MSKILLLLFAIIPFELKAQEIFRFRAVQTSYKFDAIDTSSERNWKESTDLIVVDYEQQRISLYSPDKNTYEWISNKTEPIKKEDREKIKLEQSFKVIDKRGTDVIIVVRIYTDGYVNFDGLFFFIYPDSSIVYKVKIIR